MNEKCPNCGGELTEQQKYCAGCGQRNHENLLSVSFLFRELFDNIFNVDAKIFRSFRRIWIPAQLTKDYVAGIRNKNLNQFRFFFAVLVFHVAILAFSMRNASLNFFNQDLVKDVTESNMLDAFEENAQNFGHLCDSGALDSIRQHMFEGVKPAQADTVEYFTINNMDFSTLGITKRDVLELPADSIIVKSNVKGFLNQLTVKQMIRAVKNPDAVISTVIGNLLWLGFVIVFAGALFLKLLYIRHGIYYVEHVSLLLNFQIFSWIVVSIALIINLITGSSEFGGNIWLAIMVSILYLFLSLKRYYKQGWIKTSLKFILLGIYYILAAGLTTAIIFLISFYLF